jgi:uncharacterized membrane protein YgaE (UPF0421/DUF939 family)
MNIKDKKMLKKQVNNLNNLIKKIWSKDKKVLIETNVFYNPTKTKKGYEAIPEIIIDLYKRLNIYSNKIKSNI